ncbi:MAG: hypothetical protein ACFCU5_09485 [Pleurocapsa sp.]
MKPINYKLHTTIAIAALAIIGNLAQAQPASAQLLELATGALSILGLKGQQSAPQFMQPQPVYPQNRSLTFGADNFNGNTLNFCITGCLPSTASVPTAPPVFAPQPRPVGIPQQPGVISQQSSFSSSSMGTPTGTIPPGAMVRPGVPVPPTVVPVPPQPQPRRPILTIPPISLPFNL